MTLWVCLWQEKICEDSASFDLTSSDLANTISDLNQVLEKLQAMHVYEDPVGADLDAVPGMITLLCLFINMPRVGSFSGGVSKVVTELG